MKNFLKKLHIGSNQSEDSEGSGSSSKGYKLSDVPSPERPSRSRSPHHPENKPFSAISGWLNSVTNRKSPSPPSSSNVTRGDRMVVPSDSVGSSGGLDSVLDAVKHDSESSNSRDPDIEEEFQIQMALELSAREDPEAVQIEAVKDISLGSLPPDNTPAEVIAYRYWNYNALSYEDKILDGFYDLYGILSEPTSSKMPSLIELQGTAVSDDVSWEAIFVSKADKRLLKLEQEALQMAVKSRLENVDIISLDLVRKLAIMVSNYMGGPVEDQEKMLIAWKNLSHKLKATHGSMVLPLASLTIGLARHRALLFKVLADGMGIPCRLVKGHQFTGSSDAAINFVKINDGREYIVDLMADPGTLIPSDIAAGNAEHEEPFLPGNDLPKNVHEPQFVSFKRLSPCKIEDDIDLKSPTSVDGSAAFAEPRNEGECVAAKEFQRHIKVEEGSSRPAKELMRPFGARKLTSENPSRLSGSYSHARSPSWTEGISSPAVRRMKVKDVSQYMIDAAKGNPQFAQKLHDVLLESGVVAPANLFTDYSDQFNDVQLESKSVTENKECGKNDMKKTEIPNNNNQARFLPPLPSPGLRSRGSASEPVEHQIDQREVTGQCVSSQPDVAPIRYQKNVPVAAAAAAAAAVVASSMVVAAAKTASEVRIDLPVTAAATATAAAVVATTAAVTKQYENLEIGAYSPDGIGAFCNPFECAKGDGGAGFDPHEQLGSGGGEREGNTEGDRTSDRSTGNDSSKSDSLLDDVADCEIPWEDMVLGERIGLGSYGEVYRADWHGTEVAVKKFLDQDLAGESLEEFRSEVHIMKKLRHPNVVLFMGAVTRPPHLSIVTEFLPRGSLYRLLHRPNNQLDERRRLRMALDTARGMNYLHNCTPVIVHRDLKSPNLLVDKNWVVKVCDFGLSRMKNSTFLSSRSTAGTAEWMAPEVLRNEPSDEKCDVFSYGVILWELCTMQQPWGGMNPMQVVGAVGFQHRRLEIPDDVHPAVADIILRCWQTDPKLRPSFAEIMAALKPLQKPVTGPQAPRPGGVQANRVQGKRQS